MASAHNSKEQSWREEIAGQARDEENGAAIENLGSFARRNRMKHFEVIDDRLLNEVSAAAGKTPRLRMNHNFHKSLDDKCHRFVNAVEPGSEIPIHHHPTKDETIVILRGRVKVMTFDDSGKLVDCVILSHDDGLYGVNIPKNVWHTIEAMEPGSVLFECKEGPFVPHEVEGVLERK